MLISQLSVNLFIFFLSMLGILNNRKNLLYILINLELMLLCLNLNFIMFSLYLDDIYGQIFSLFILTIAAAESAVGLAIAILFYRANGSTDLNQVPVIVF
jgi:NADH-quinone oxidoreductase subunit K